MQYILYEICIHISQENDYAYNVLLQLFIKSMNAQWFTQEYILIWSSEQTKKILPTKTSAPVTTSSTLNILNKLIYLLIEGESESNCSISSATWWLIWLFNKPHLLKSGLSSTSIFSNPNHLDTRISSYTWCIWSYNKTHLSTSGFSCNSVLFISNHCRHNKSSIYGPSNSKSLAGWLAGLPLVGISKIQHV